MKDFFIKEMLNHVQSITISPLINTFDSHIGGNRTVFAYEKANVSIDSDKVKKEIIDFISLNPKVTANNISYPDYPVRVIDDKEFVIMLLSYSKEEFQKLYLNNPIYDFDEIIDFFENIFTGDYEFIEISFNTDVEHNE